MSVLQALVNKGGLLLQVNLLCLPVPLQPLPPSSPLWHAVDLMEEVVSEGEGEGGGGGNAAGGGKKGGKGGRKRKQQEAPKT